VSFNVAADAYDRFMGRYSRHLAPQMADLGDVEAGQRALDVGCGPGALTSELVARLGPTSVAAVDPSPPFVEAARERHPGVDVRQASADALPFGDGAFDAALAQLVVHFMPDPVAGLREMARVTRQRGVLVACVWDHAGGEGPLGAVWNAVRELDPSAPDESELPGARRGHLQQLFEAAGLHDVGETSLDSRVEHPTFEDWWEPFTGGVGPAGAYVAALDDPRRNALRDRCRAILGPAPFVITARAWAARGVVA
jgi:SAM-dependent methyltransferase